jgi:hypothetical protein
MPWPTRLHFQGPLLTVEKDTDDSGYLVAPWDIDGFGRLMGTSATLMERTNPPYQFLVELVRGKVNQVRSQAADWQAGGLQLAPGLQQHLQALGQDFGRVVCTGPPEIAAEEHTRQLQHVLLRAYQAGEQLVQAYTQQVFHIRHQRQQRLETVLSCRLDRSVLQSSSAEQLLAACNRVTIPLSWHTIQTEETRYRWDQADALLDWAEARGLDVAAGPLIDFSSSQLPDWLWVWDGDVPSLATFMCRFVEAAIRRYRVRIRRWQLTAASNWATVLGLTEDDLMNLTFRLGETARQVDPALELVVGVSQPWGEYMALADRAYSPFIFADNLIRSGLNLGALDVEMVMGVSSRGSYCRDLLEFSRLLDLYALLGVPLRVTMGYPADQGHDPEADPEMAPGAGFRQSGYDAASQADWVRSFVALTLCKPFVQGVQWTHLADAQPHLFPHCGLLDPQGTARPALQVLAELRREHLG